MKTGTKYFLYLLLALFLWPSGVAAQTVNVACTVVRGGPDCPSASQVRSALDTLKLDPPPRHWTIILLEEAEWVKAWKEARRGLRYQTETAFTLTLSRRTYLRESAFAKKPETLAHTLAHEWAHLSVCGPKDEDCAERKAARTTKKTQ